jgi:glycosyltransferase involved in cell wall biosynthesis
VAKTPKLSPAVSFIVPVYNSAAVLAATLSSILAQSLTLIEVIVVDDGSTDKSLSIAQQIAQTDSRLRVIANVHGGVCLARNTGLKHATGEWVTFIDSDDTVSPDYAKLGLQLAANVSVDLIIFSMSLLTLDASTQRTENWLLEDENFDSPQSFLAALVVRGEMCLYSAGNKLYRRSILIRAGINFEASREFGEDRIFNFTYLHHCGAISTHSHVAYHYYRRPQITASASQISRPELLHLALDLHEQKKSLLHCFGFTTECALDFFTADLSREIHDCINAVKTHWDHLSRAQKRRICASLTTADYPSYLRNIRPPTLAGRIFFWALKNHQPSLLYVFFSLSH